jgi:hypothetical protein
MAIEHPGEKRHKSHQAYRANNHGYPERPGQTADFYRLRFTLGFLKRRRTMPDRRLVSHLLVRSLSCITVGIASISTASIILDKPSFAINRRNIIQNQYLEAYQAVKERRMHPSLKFTMNLYEKFFSLCVFVRESFA